MPTQSTESLLAQDPILGSSEYIGAEEGLRSIANREFRPYFQPIIVLRTGQLDGFEALTRWEHSLHGFIPPSRFIPQAEKHGWIHALSQQTLREAFASASLIPAPLTLSVNISPLQLRDPGLPQQIRDSAQITGFALDRVKIEITESALIGNLKLSLSIAQELKCMGCKLVLDDFGTGYSSLLHLQSLPFDEIKIDRSFVNSMITRRENRKIVVAVIGLGQSLKLTTVAEGVETQEQEDMLQWMGCDLAQGWCYGKPLPAESLTATVAKLRKKTWTSALNPSRTGSAGSLDALPAQRLAQLQAVYDGAPVGLAFLDRNLRHMSINQRLADMNHLAVEDHLGKTVAEILPVGFLQLEPYLRRALLGEAIEGVELRMPASAGVAEAVRLCSYQPARDEAGEVVGISVAVLDITTRKHMEEALHESEQHCRSLVELSPQIPWTMDPDGQNLDVSPRFEAMTGLTKEQSRGRGWMKAMHANDLKPVSELVAAALRSEQPMDVTYRLRDRAGEWHWMRSRGAPRFGDDGTVVCWYGVLENVDELQRTGAELKASQRRVKWSLITHIWEAFWRAHPLFR